MSILFRSEVRVDQDVDRQIGALLVVMQELYPANCQEEKAESQAKLLIYWSIFVPVVTYGHELRVITKKSKKSKYKKLKCIFFTGWWG